MKLNPLGDRVVIKTTEIEEKKYGSIIIPETVAKEKPQTGEVVAVGTEEDVQASLKVGDTVIYRKYGGTEISLDDEDYIILEYNDILAKVE